MRWRTMACAIAIRELDGRARSSAAGRRAAEEGEGGSGRRYGVRSSPQRKQHTAIKDCGWSGEAGARGGETLLQGPGRSVRERCAARRTCRRGSGYRKSGGNNCGGGVECAATRREVHLDKAERGLKTVRKRRCPRRDVLAFPLYPPTHALRLYRTDDKETTHTPQSQDERQIGYYRQGEEEKHTPTPEPRVSRQIFHAHLHLPDFF